MNESSCVVPANRNICRNDTLQKQYYMIYDIINQIVPTYDDGMFLRRWKKPVTEGNNPHKHRKNMRYSAQTLTRAQG